MIFDLLAIQIFVTLLIDYTGAVDSMLTPLVRWITGSKIGHIGRPFNCSLCSSWWLMALYLLLTHQVTLWSLTLALALACTTDITLALFLLLKDGIGAVIECIENLFK